MASSEAVKQQLQVWDRLMHLNVKMHAALRSLNQMPRGDEKLLEKAPAEVRERHAQVKKNVGRLVELLSGLETRLAARTLQSAEDQEDEEIPSSESEAEPDEQSAEQDDEAEQEDDGAGDERRRERTHRRVKLDRAGLRALETGIQRRDRAFEQKRAAVLDKWFERTRLTVAKKGKDNFDDLETSVVAQIKKILADRARLVRRTQLKRVNVERLGAPADQTHDPEMFDDDDFYQTQLKEFIDQKSADTLDPIQISRQWLEVQKLRQQRAKKKQVEKRATKGRKIRYVPIPKLANFVAARPEAVPWSHERRNELFKSVFRY